MNIKVECVCCRNCFDVEELNMCIDTEVTSIEDLQDLANSEDLEFDCPDCYERQYLSDCEFF